MSAQPVSFAWPGGVVSLDDRGRVLLQVEGVSAPVRLGLTPDPGLREVLVEYDTAEHAGSDEYEVSQRVTVGEHCQLRWATEAASPARVELEVEVPPGQQAWVWPSGADGLLAVFPETGLGPALVVQVMQGSLTWAGESADGRRLRLGVAELAAGDRQVTMLRVRRLPTLAIAENLLPRWYEPLALVEGEGWEADIADFGLQAEPLTVVYEEDDETVLIAAPAPGKHRIGLHGRRGVTELMLEVAPDLDALTRQVAEELLAAGHATWTSAGAVVVQQAVALGLLPSDRHVEDALDRFDWTTRGDSLAIAFGCRRALQEGERAMAEEAVRQLVALPDRRRQAQVFGLVALAAATLGGDLPSLAGVLRPVSRPVLADRLHSRRRTAVAADELGGVINRLGAGLPGRPIGLSPADAAELVILLEACPERWPEARLAADTSQEMRLKLLAGYAAGDIVDPTALAWLLIGG